MMIAKTKKVKYNQSKVCEENINWGSHINPIGTLRDGEIYEIEREEVHTWHTKIFLKGVNGSCNSVWFDKITDQILDMPVDGVQVTKECTNCKDKDFLLLRLLCPYCNNTGKIVRPLTIGEALEILPRMVTGLKSMSNGDAFLTTKDGGIVEVKG